MFRTELKPAIPDFQINLKTNLLSMGSCFADEMGTKLEVYKFNALTNPGGILFNPISIFRLLDLAFDQQPLPSWTFVKRQSIHFNYLLHSEMAANSPQALGNKFEALSNDLRDRTKKADLIIFTFGTAFVYKLLENEEIVANCHRIPQKHFAKQLLRTQEIVEGFEATKAKIEARNPNVRFLLTVSPVRHIKEGIPENNVSKSTLRLACHQLCEAFKNVSYFPAYEIMMDDLRDYRFYEKDLIHPNEQARDYIWDAFGKTYFDQEANHFVKEWAKIRTALSHRPFHSESEEHQQFLKTTLLKLQNFSHLVDVSEETDYLQRQLNPS